MHFFSLNRADSETSNFFVDIFYPVNMFLLFLLSLSSYYSSIEVMSYVRVERRAQYSARQKCCPKIHFHQRGRTQFF